MSNTVNIRHDLDQILVQATIDKKVACYQQQRDAKKKNQIELCAKYAAEPSLFSRAPQPPEDMEAMYDRWILVEKEHYATVRVIELPKGATVSCLCTGTWTTPRLLRALARSRATRKPQSGSLTMGDKTMEAQAAQCLLRES